MRLSISIIAIPSLSSADREVEPTSGEATKWFQVSHLYMMGCIAIGVTYLSMYRKNR